MKNKKMSRAVTGVVLAGALTIGVVPAASATAAAPVASSSSVSLSAAPAPVAPVAPKGGEAPGSTTAAPLAVRLAVKAGMAVLKRTNVRWYNAIVAQANRGRAAFVRWWDSSVPTWVKKTLGVGGAAIGGNAAYDALLWVLGIG